MADMSDYSQIPGVQQAAPANMSVDPAMAAAQQAPAAPAPQMVPAGSMMPTDAEQNNMSGMMGVSPPPPMDPTAILNDPDAHPDDKLNAMSYLQSQQQAQQQQQQAAQLAQDAKDKNSLDAYNTKVKQVSDYNTVAQQKGFPSIPMPTPDQFGLDAQQIAKLSQPDVQQDVQPVADALKQKQQLDATSQKSEDLMKQQAAALNGMQKAAGDIQKAHQQSLDLAIKQVDDKQDQLDQVDPNRFWNNKSTGQKILAALAVGLGRLGSGGKDNPALDQINKYINQDIDTQKYSIDKKLELKQQALKRVGLEIEKFSAVSQDNYRKAEMSKMANDIKMQQDNLRQQQILQQHLLNRVGNGTGLSPNEAEAVVQEKDKPRLVTLPTGNVTLAPNKETADALNKSMPAMLKAQDLANEYSQLVKSVGMQTRATPEMFSDTKQRINAIKTELVPLLKEVNGATGMRLNNQMFDKIDKNILGDPTALFQDHNVQVHKADAMKQMVNSFVANSYRAAGVKVQDSAEHQMRMEGLNKGMSLEQVNQVIDNMKKQGKLK